MLTRARPPSFHAGAVTHNLNLCLAVPLPVENQFLQPVKARDLTAPSPHPTCYVELAKSVQSPHAKAEHRTPMLQKVVNWNPADANNSTAFPPVPACHGDSVTPVTNHIPHIKRHPYSTEMFFCSWRKSNSNFTKAASHWLAPFSPVCSRILGGCLVLLIWRVKRRSGRVLFGPRTRKVIFSVFWMELVFH